MPENALSRFALYAARPTIRIKGEEKERVSGLMRAMEMCEHEDGLSTLELHLDNIATDPTGTSDFAFEDEMSFRLGDIITVYCGDESGPTEIFRGTISAIEARFQEEASPVIVALAEDALQKARLKRRTRTFQDKKLGEIAEVVARDLGLRPVISGFTDTIGVQVQLNESDLAFLRRLLARYDGDVQVVGEELHVSPRSEVERGTVELTLTSQLRSVTAIADLAHQVDEVTVGGWDSARGRRIRGRSSGGQRGPGTGRTSSELLSQALTRRTHHISHVVVEDEDEANALAKAAFEERQRRFVTVNAVAEGNPSIRVGTHVMLSGLGPRFSNTYYVTKCVHRYDLERGYETDFTAETAFFGEP